MTKRSITVSLLVLLIFLAGGGFLLFKKNIGTVHIPNKVSSGDGIPSLSGFTLPAGFALTVFAENVPGARVIEIDPQGRLLVSETSEGKIVALSDTDNDHMADEEKVLISGLQRPHGMAMKCEENGDCFLYVAESDVLSRFLYNADTLSLGTKEKLMAIGSSLTDRHFTRSLLFLPSPEEDTLLISVGSSCDACNEKDADQGSVLSYNIKTGTKEVYALGLRNATFMAIHPVDGNVFATEMGRDGLGDEIPPDEINIIHKGKNYGWPYCYGKNIRDTKFSVDKRLRCTEGVGDTPSFIDIPAHSAPLGLAFIPEEGWPEDYWYDLLVAYHGSWNRSSPTGYKIVRLKLNAQGEYLGTEDFITGWLTDKEEKTGRPVDIKVFSGGVAYITDDSTGVVYRLSR